MKRFKGRQEKAQRQARKDTKASKERFKGMQEKTQTQARKDSKASKKSLKGTVRGLVRCLAAPGCTCIVLTA